ncbi:hypothetical protein V6N13_032136 [Hibiscus sabdariffa]
MTEEAERTKNEKEETTRSNGHDLSNSGKSNGMKERTSQQAAKVGQFESGQLIIPKGKKPMTQKYSARKYSYVVEGDRKPSQMSLS